jgi:hypothetical protein
MIMSWLALKDAITGRTTYTKFCREKGLRRKTAVPVTNLVLMEAVNTELIRLVTVIRNCARTTTPPISST